MILSALDVALIIYSSVAPNQRLLDPACSGALGRIVSYAPSILDGSSQVVLPKDDDNVIKIKEPLVFGRQNAEEFLEKFESSLGEI